MSARSARPNWADYFLSPGNSFGFPKSRRILRRSDFRTVYDKGMRHTSRFFAAFCLRIPEQTDGPRIGFTVPRAQGKSVARNRIRRRMREAVRLNLSLLPVSWSVVFNPRRTVLDAEFPVLQHEIRRVFERCVNS